MGTLERELNVLPSEDGNYDNSPASMQKLAGVSTKSLDSQHLSLTLPQIRRSMIEVPVDPLNEAGHLARHRGILGKQMLLPARSDLVAVWHATHDCPPVVRSALGRSLRTDRTYSQGFPHRANIACSNRLSAHQTAVARRKIDRWLGPRTLRCRLH